MDYRWAKVSVSQPDTPPRVHAVVDNLPVVPEEKYEKLVSVLKKIYGQIGHVREGKVSTLDIQHGLEVASLKWVILTRWHLHAQGP
jgi:hypothetical protein